MKIFYVERKTEGGYDTYSDMVVIAKDQRAARRMHPDGNCMWSEIQEAWVYMDYDGEMKTYSSETWEPKLKNIEVEYLGDANPVERKARVVCASFHAG